MEVYARYVLPSSGPNADVVGSLVNLVATGTFGHASGEVAYTGFNNYLPGATSAVTASGSNPKAYLNYIIFNSSYTSYQFGWAGVTSDAATNFEKLALEVTVPAGYANGYAYIFITNESNYNKYFDDFYILHEKTNLVPQVTQTSDYYPFGVSFNLYNKESVYPNRYLYQGQENQDDLLYDEYQYRYRMHDPAMGRFLSLDPLAEDFRYNSVYAFSENKVINGIELEGKEQIPTFQKYEYGDNNFVNGFKVAGNAITHTVNFGIGLLNSAMYCTTGLYNTSPQQVGQEMLQDFRLTKKRVGTYLADQKDYFVNTPASQQFSDTFTALGRAETYEGGATMALNALLTRSFTPSPSAFAQNVSFMEAHAARGVATQYKPMLNLSELKPTHYILDPKSDMIKLVQNIKANGIQNPLRYVEDGGMKYLVQGNQRFFAAQKLGIGQVPVEQVTLPFAGYKTAADLLLTGKQAGWWKYYKP